ncbi:hypothetical protein Moror_16392 [Moniliophthora roreri MCA 2997]|uniref:Uncharacterized protein n=2 Tax=Moniliophthora roreri TaxID=221103 RepID=V2YH13_MONRO|nr:hypothetical protein Moror_16392 [Moniliophthora roreri MCA 2997]
MSFFQGSSNFTIHGGQFTNTQTSQYITHIHGNLVQVVSQREKEPTIWDDYRRVRAGDIYVLRQIGETKVGRENIEGWRKVVARRTINLARIEDREKEFLHVTYEGPDAYEAFRLDFEEFSSVRKSNVVQLFGYNNRRNLPALIFHDELIPLSRIILVNNQPSPVLWTYFEYQFRIMQMANDYLNVGELWIDARTGMLRKGPYLQPLPHGYLNWLIGGFWSISNIEGHFTPVSLQAFNKSSTVLEYLASKLPTHDIIRGISGSRLGIGEQLIDEQIISILSSLPGTIYNRHCKEMTARWTDVRKRWRYGLWQVFQFPYAVGGSGVEMEYSLVRFTVMPTDIREMQVGEFQYALYPDDVYGVFTQSWLAQAHSIFGQLGIHKDDWEEYSLCRSFKLVLQRTEGKTDTTALTFPVYLFIRPIPRPSDSETLWRSWMEGNKYFWSFDDLGNEEISAETRVSLGLPSFTSSILLNHLYWNHSAYEAMEWLHRHHGFNPRTTGLVRSLDYPVFETVRDDQRFHDLDDSEVLLSSHVTELDVDGPDEYTSSEGSESDEETILYPRTRLAVVTE